MRSVLVLSFDDLAPPPSMNWSSLLTCQREVALTFWRFSPCRHPFGPCLALCAAFPLVMSERQGVEIDYCPQCRGVWLDRGELDKILSAAARKRLLRCALAPQAQPPQQHYGLRSHIINKAIPSAMQLFLEELFD